MTKEGKQTLIIGGVVAGGVLLVYLMSGKGAINYQGPSLSLGGSPGGNVSLGNGDTAPAFSFPGVTLPGNGSGVNTPANVSTGTPQCGCQGIGLNQSYYGGATDAATSLAPIVLAALQAATAPPAVSGAPSWSLSAPSVAPSAAPTAPRIGTTAQPSPAVTLNQLRFYGSASGLATESRPVLSPSQSRVFNYA